MAKNTNVTKRGGGILGGLIIVVIGIMLLSFNEGRTVKTQSAINEAMKEYKDVTSEKIDSKNEGKVIATTGKLDLSNTGEIKDSKFGIVINGAKLLRKAEMYQWVEECETDENDNKNCTYTKEWRESLIDSSEFTKPGYTNPTSFKYESEDFLGSNIKVGEFDLPERLLKDLSYNKDLNNEKLSEMYKEPVDNFKLEGNYLINSVNTEDTQIGDIRLSYKYASDGEVSMLGVQKGNTLSAFTGKKGKTIFKIKRGNYTGKEILNEMTSSNKRTKWLLRAVGTLAVILGTASIFAPLQNLTDTIPVLRNIVNIGTGLVSTVLGLAISLLVIAISWFRYRPVLSIVLIVIIIALIVFLKVYKKDTPKKK